MAQEFAAVISPERASRIHHALGQATELLDQLASDLVALETAADRAPAFAIASASDAEAGRLFLAARSAQATAEALQAHATEILGRIESACYAGRADAERVREDEAHVARWLSAQVRERERTIAERLHAA